MFNIFYSYSQTKNVLILAADYSIDLQNSLINTHKFNSVDIFNAHVSTPTLSELSNYDAILVSSNYQFANSLAIGNVLADYIDAGGGVVNSLFAMNEVWSISTSSRFYTANYNLIAHASIDYSNISLNLVKTDPTHPILNGVNSFIGGSTSYTIENPTVSIGSSVIATWNTWPLVIVNDNIGVRHVKRVDLNFYPNPDNGWDASTDGALLIANSLLYVCNGSVPTFANPGNITICQNGSYFLDPSTTNGIWVSSDPLVATVDTRGYVTAGSITGTTTISLENSGGTVTASITVESDSELSIIDPLAQAAYKINNNPQGPIGGTINYVGYNGFNYSSQTRPINSGFYKASLQSGNEAGCPYQFYIYRCSTCGIVPSYGTRPQGTLTGNTIQANGTGQLIYTSSNGEGPFTIVYQLIGGDTKTVTDVSSGEPFNIGPYTSTTSYKLISVTDEDTKASTDFANTIGTISIVDPPTATLSGELTICPESTATLSLTTTGTGNITVTLSNGTVVNTTSGTTTFSVSPTINTTYTISSVIDVSGAGTSNGTANVTINNTATPVITSQPIASVTISEGNSATLSVTATGATGYQWYKDGNEIIDATTISYTTVNTLSATGTYYVIVNGACSTTVSSTNSVVSVTALPQGSLSGSSIMPGQAGYLRYTSSNNPAGGPFTIIYQEDGGSIYTISNVISGDIFEIQGSSISNTTSFTLISVTDQTSTGSRTFEFTGATATVTVSNLNIGDSYEGGKIAYFLQRGDLGYIEGEMHGLIAASEDIFLNSQRAAVEWGCVTNTIQGASGSAIGTGAQNTADILSGCLQRPIAASLAADYQVGQYTDWFLPSAIELEKLRDNRALIGGFDDDLWYWSSTQILGAAHAHWIGPNAKGGIDKTDPRAVRAIRVF